MKRAILLVVALLTLARGASAETVRVLLPDRDNLQYMAFWIALGAGYFRDEGIDIALSIPDAPEQVNEYLRRADSEVAVLPPPRYLELIAARFPLVLVANLLRNDPIDLVVRRSVLTERRLSRSMPLKARLEGLRGLRLGIAPNPPTRLRALFDANGLDADRDVQIVILRGPEQNYAFGEGRVDALYAHTPYLETAIVDQDAELLVDQSGGDVPLLAMRQIHALVCTRALVERDPSTVTALVRAVARAERLVHTAKGAAVEALLRIFGSMDKRKVETIVDLYEPAVPESPRVTVDGLRPALALYPASRPAPSLDGIDLSRYVAPRFALAAASSGEDPVPIVLAIAIAVVGCAAAVALGRRST